MNNFSSFLEIKITSSLVHKWKLVWAVCDSRCVKLFQDETENNLVHNIYIAPTATVEVLPPISDRKNIFQVLLPINTKMNQAFEATDSVAVDFTFSAFDSTTFESWVIVFIQLINGALRPSENFDARESLHIESNVLFAPLRGNADVTHSNEFTLYMISDLLADNKSLNSIYGNNSGYMLQKQPSKEWLKQYFILHNSLLINFDNEEKSSSFQNFNGKLVINQYTKLFLLPEKCDNNIYSFSIVSYNKYIKSYVSMRLACFSKENLYTWISILQYEIQNNCSTYERENSICERDTSETNNKYKIQKGYRNSTPDIRANSTGGSDGRDGDNAHVGNSRSENRKRGTHQNNLIMESICEETTLGGKQEIGRAHV